MKHYNQVSKKLSALLAFLLIGVTTAFAQIQASGTVTDESGEPIIGASVLEKGTTNGAITDFDGNFELRTKSGATLVISYVGYVAQEVKAGTSLRVVLKEDTEVLDELVVVGYGVQKKSNLTGAISAVKDQDMTNRTLSDATQALQGKTAGVYLSSSSGAPGSEATVRIRGVGSNGSSSPLYVIDGRIAPEGMGALNAEDIKSIEVLKDGASAAIYGARAGNGVILITTKNGEGEGKITYQFQTTFQDFGRIPKTMSAREYIDYYLEAGTITESAFSDWNGNTNTNWVDELTETSVMQRHTLTFQKGDRGNNIYLSTTYLDNNGPVLGNKDSMKRLNVTLNGNWQFKKWLSVSTNNQIGYSSTKSLASNSVMLAAIRTDPVTKAYYTLDELKVYNEAYYNYALDPSLMGEVLKNKDGLFYGISKYTSAGMTNPLITLAATDSKTNALFLNGSTALNLTPIDGLTFTSRIGYRFAIIENNSKTGDYYAGGNTKRPYASVSATERTPTYYQWENFINFNKTFGSHDINAMAGMSFSQDRSYYITGTYTGNEGDFGFQKDQPNYMYWAYATSAAEATKTMAGAEPLFTRNLSYFGRIGWSYKGRYMLQGTLRADAADTSVLPVAERWGYFPAVSAGWTVSEESFFKPLKKAIPFLKLRASWGQNGSTASLGNHSYAASMSSTGFYAVPTPEGYTYITSYSPDYTGNNNLKWETSEQLDFGVDMRFLDGALTFSFDWYKKDTKDLIVTGSKPTISLGLPSSPINAGNIQNKGIEFELGYSGRIGDLRYSIRGNGATVKNMVTYLDESVGSLEGTSIHPYGAVTRFEAGHPAWYFYGYKFKGIDPTNGEVIVEDLDGDGVVGDGDLTDIGNGIPKFTYGLTLTMNWKNLDLLVFSSGALGQKTYMWYDYTAYNYNKLNYYTDDRWTPSNTDGTRPVAGASSYRQFLQSDRSVVSSNYLKIKQIQIGYTLPKNVISKMKLENLRIYASLDDFFVFTNYPGYDPEIVGTSSTLNAGMGTTTVTTGLGVDQGTYPSTRKIVLGLNVTF